MNAKALSAHCFCFMKSAQGDNKLSVFFYVAYAFRINTVIF